VILRTASSKHRFHFARSASISLPAGVLIFTQSEVRAPPKGESARLATEVPRVRYSK
jgi:hypothetical protein